jgi:hydroxymethylbilane synthase
MRRIRIGSRGSRLALVQAESTRDALARALPHAAIEIQLIQTEGDRVLDRPLSAIGGSGLFIKEIEAALLEGKIDLAVHSMKDLESATPEGLALAATTERIDPRDALVSRTVGSLEELPQGATIATGSLRRRSQLLAARPDLNVVDLRGNVPTRLLKYDRSSWDGVVLASAGLLRLDCEHRIRSFLSSDVMVPAVGQGALALETRADDSELMSELRFLNHPETEIAVRAERSFLARLAGGCRVPIGGHAVLGEDGTIVLTGYVGSLDGARHLRRSVEGRSDSPEALGARLADSLMAEGAKEIIASLADGP